MEATTQQQYFIRDQYGYYLSIDREGVLITSTIPVPATGVPDTIRTASPEVPELFTLQARHIISRFFYSEHGGEEGVLFISYDNINVSLNFFSIDIRNRELTIAIESPEAARLYAKGLGYTIPNWKQITEAVTDYHLCDQAGRYYCLVDGVTTLVDMPVPVNGVPHIFPGTDFTKRLLFVGDAARILQGLHNDNGAAAVCDLCYDQHREPLDFTEIILRKPAAACYVDSVLIPRMATPPLASKYA